MNWRRFVRAIALAVTLTLSRPAWGCLNDRDVLSAEGEFRSSYLKVPDPSPVEVGNYLGWAAVLVGVGLAAWSYYILPRAGGRNTARAAGASAGG